MISDILVQMDFPEAMRAVIEGNKITRLEWHNSDYAFLHGDRLRLMREGGLHDWLVSDGDMLAQDWVIV
jgi:hypothetical protein